MSVPCRKRLYLLFFVSGFCSLVYQMVWTRLAFASFGIITPVLSVVLSVFMLGLFLGAWAGGRTILWLTRKSGWSAIFFYGGAEFVIGLGAFAAPKLFVFGQQFLLPAGQMDSFGYLFLSALVLGASILPWCLFMGATFPWMMAYVREEEARNADSFSFLYFANVLGAMTGTLLTAFVLVEILGFRHTLALAAAGNFAIALGSAQIGWSRRGKPGDATMIAPTAADEATALPPAVAGGGLIRWILFTTGFCAMAMEVVWTRAFMPVLKTQVYSFAAIVFTYLGATFLGSLVYRWHLRRKARLPLGQLMALLALMAFLPIVALDPRVLPAKLNLDGGDYTATYASMVFVLASICPLCAILGYLTPSLIDQFAGGHPAAAGKAYAINVVGCILGPLCASYLLLPHLNERFAMTLLVLPLLGLGFLCRKSLSRVQSGAAAVAACLALFWSFFLANDFEGLLNEREVNTAIRRDYAASVISFGEGFGRILLVNGVGMTLLASETKFMVHLPMVLHKEKPQSVLIICFGMGTGYRSALSWDVPTTAVELVPSVIDAFPFYHADMESVFGNPNGHIVIDDGRRYLKRTREKYDVIVVDPPPPVEAAGSSLLYSKEFYELAKEHLNPNGILQTWLPGGSKITGQAVARSVAESFPHVRSIDGLHGWGVHFLCSMQPINLAPATELAARMPLKAQHDFMEWLPPKFYPTLPDGLQSVLGKEDATGQELNPDLKIQITDDQPFNEYYLMREWNIYAP